jgi:E3 SUMO-protein ligase RanBP2
MPAGGIFGGGGASKFSFGALASGTASVPKVGFGGGFKEQKAQPMFGAISKPTTGDGEEPTSPGATGDDNPEVFEANVDFKPVCPLPDKIDVVTGEENETALFTHRAKLFRFVSGEFKERGVGDFKILRHNQTGKTRCVMRREIVHKLCANFALSSSKI